MSSTANGGRGPTLRIVIPGRPFPLRRHRHGTRGGFDHPENARWKQTAGWCYVEAIQRAGLSRPAFPSGPLELVLLALFPAPKRRALEDLWHVGPVDLSNLQKAVEDAGNGVLWADDRQIARSVAEKAYSAPQSLGITVVDVRPLERLSRPVDAQRWRERP